jgi:hypothetical protein
MLQFNNSSRVLIHWISHLILHNLFLKVILKWIEVLNNWWVLLSIMRCSLLSRQPCFLNTSSDLFDFILQLRDFIEYWNIRGNYVMCLSPWDLKIKVSFLERRCYLRLNSWTIVIEFGSTVLIRNFSLNSNW